MGSMADSRHDESGGELENALAAALPRWGFWEWPVLVGVSGGADSVALLVALMALAHKRDSCHRIIVGHAHHGLRAEADDDQRFVETLAGELGAECVTARLALGAAVGNGGEGLEARARRLRYEWLGRAAHQFAARHVVVAHTADDQAETILHRILRGTGVAGLSGMRRARRLVDGVALLRPLLEVRRDRLRRYLADRGQLWREDATNADPRFARAVLRHEVIPRVEQGAWPAATEALLRLGAQAALVSAAISSAAGVLLDRNVQRLPDGSLQIDAGALAGLDGHLLAGLFAALWQREGWPQRDMTAEHYRRLVSMLQTAEGQLRGPVCFPGGVRASVTASGAIALRRVGADAITPEVDPDP